MLRGKKYFLGRYENKDEAIAVRKKAETELFEPLIQKYKKERGKKGEPTNTRNYPGRAHQCWPYPAGAWLAAGLLRKKRHKS
jgi:hypothetical protein